MSFIPHKPEQIKKMLNTIGVSSIEDLFNEIPLQLRAKSLKIEDGINEIQLANLAKRRAGKNHQNTNFIGAGAYSHYIPSAIWDIVGRGEFYTAYTPYQAEASQGSLQVIYEYQTMMAGLTGMAASNASMYDGATALAESVLMAIRSNKKAKSQKVLIIEALHPTYLRVLETITKHQGIEIDTVRLNSWHGKTNVNSLEKHQDQSYAAVVIQSPNFLGQIADVDNLTNWAHSQGALVIAVTNPMSLAILKSPADWGENGVDIVCGEGQPMGVPLASGGPYFGFMTCKMDHVRQMPGRIVGRTVDLDGKEGFCLTLQAREQHIRRAKATSNICTNQGLMVTAATIYMSLLGAEGLQRVASVSHENTTNLANQLSKIDGVGIRFSKAFFNEVVIDLPVNAEIFVTEMEKEGIDAGYFLGEYHSDLANSIMICSTEIHTEEDMVNYTAAAKRVLARLGG
ncbi:aminomethyl-transferring glycine dehydrogenase subunit GcvPA [Allofrancisella guangzhouensis]|uniref:Probable glycine dehydrogenase (decarboxylating) subunit 1 n=1 Tax=Allofrancisella guangzhouensis TaxID=594679 RepID=A0A0A8E5J7_9GAMM|nr:aminomethyl-transferring glycine dehydrogenase subunit GcvPA [Allofrancisella guangzhouensis]AJC49278.1 glycine dehydrogenase [Allofrancisella guangzhouensis]MBK2027723.1 aminomethyl-transferring glycine dehydrogenase subunit GcvPA [Allofrancisella guangzhouensis]MBK2044004.1 aminomethyl-transferring glycine dehydrogenase subunit GcvPA [Allofrancisella guangzhouensis]MBK2046388.1 aminomethyl-transferring glycine dehydrogenase subunit GcvPA [Allofrancisella guangzhouensis]